MSLWNICSVCKGYLAREITNEGRWTPNLGGVCWTTWSCTLYSSIWQRRLGQRSEEERIRLITHGKLNDILFFVCFVFCIIFIFGVLIFSVELNDESNCQRNKSLFYCVVKSLKRLVMVMAQWAKVRSKKQFYAVAEIFTTGIFTIWLICNASANKRVELITWDFAR